MLQQDHPEDFVIATGVQYTPVRDRREGMESASKGTKVSKKELRRGKRIVDLDAPPKSQSRSTEQAQKLGWSTEDHLPRALRMSAERDELVKKHGFTAYDING